VVCLGSVGAGEGAPDSEKLSEGPWREYEAFEDMSYTASARNVNTTSSFEINEGQVSPDANETSERF